MKKTLFHRITARLRKNKLYAGILAATGRPLRNRKWVFIVGCYNSGTTLLDQILASHQDISGLPDEGVILTDSLMRPEDFGWRRMWWKCESELSIDSNHSCKVAERVKRHWSHFYRGEGKYLLEKSIANTCRMRFFEQEFDSPFFIHIVRNGYAVAEGINRKAQVMDSNPLRPLKHYPIDYCAHQWKRSLEVVERDKPLVKNFIEVRYEDLTEHPDQTVTEILHYLKLPAFGGQLLDRQFFVHQNFSAIKNMNDESISRLSINDIATFNSIASDSLKKYGYSVLPS